MLHQHHALSRRKCNATRTSQNKAISRRNQTYTITHPPPTPPKAPSDAVDFLVSKGAALDPRRLLPALARFGEPGADGDGRLAALRYIRYAVESLGCTDRWAAGGSVGGFGWLIRNEAKPTAGSAQKHTPTRVNVHQLAPLTRPPSTVHNLAVALLSADADEAPLLDYLSRGGRNPLGRPLYDPKYALRLVQDRDRWVV